MIKDNLELGIPQEQIVEKLCRYFGLDSDKAWELLVASSNELRYNQYIKNRRK